MKILNAGTAKLVIVVHKDFAQRPFWEKFNQSPEAAAAEWIGAHTSAKLLDMHRPSWQSDTMETLQVVVTLADSALPALMKASGASGVFTRPFYDSSGEAGVHKLVPLQTTCLASALRTAKSQAGSIGLVATKKRLTLRVLAEAHEAAVREIHVTSPNQFLGKRWEASGFPLEWGDAAVKAFLDPWVVEPIFNKRAGLSRTWILRSMSDPPHVRLSHPWGEVLISTPKPKQTQPPRGTTQKWSPPMGGGTKTWAQMAKTSAQSVLPGGVPKFHRFFVFLFLLFVVSTRTAHAML